MKCNPRKCSHEEGKGLKKPESKYQMREKKLESCCERDHELTSRPTCLQNGFRIERNVLGREEGSLQYAYFGRKKDKGRDNIHI